MKRYDQLVADLKNSGDLYWQESAKLQFATGIQALMDSQDISRTELARRLGKSCAYVTQTLRGDKNVTIETMVTIARRAGGKLHINVCDHSHESRFFSWVTGSSVKAAQAQKASLFSRRADVAQDSRQKMIGSTRHETESVAA